MEGKGRQGGIEWNHFIQQWKSIPQWNGMKWIDSNLEWNG